MGHCSSVARVQTRGRGRLYLIAMATNAPWTLFGTGFIKSLIQSFNIHTVIFWTNLIIAILNLQSHTKYGFGVDPRPMHGRPFPKDQDATPPPVFRDVHSIETRTHASLHPGKNMGEQKICVIRALSKCAKYDRLIRPPVR